ncbi:LysM peptidoglycan-binding domain-containing protein [Pararhodospirillum photometricum]|uniref:LysM peptidoglycan-binding domain-containing protein n=1 Tax=Pararhodospirillum photometricum TaxID=1084 RepID=UPI0006862B7F|nr:LysM peptidoglycan-binding domain-containing protein [Pararhodospirillum photometricum]
MNKRTLLVVGIVGGVILLVIWGAVMMSRTSGSTTGAEPPQATTSQVTPTTSGAIKEGALPSQGPLPPASSAATTPEAPVRFDVVRVEKGGDIVAAGKATPGATVAVKSGSRTVGQVTADSRGEWVLAPDTPLDPGQHLLTLEARPVEGAPVQGQESVAVVVPSAAGPETEASVPLVVALPERGSALSARILQGFGESRAAPELSIETVDYDSEGRLVVGGTAAPNDIVRVYLDTAVVGEQETRADNRWHVVGQNPLKPGTYSLRADRLTPDGTVTGRVEIPFQRPETLPTPEPGGALLVVQPGNNLWRLARSVYGEGWRYTVIFQANREHIRDPDLIYPGQVFTVPRPEPVREPEGVSRSPR